MTLPERYRNLPGAEFVETGLRDLAAGATTEAGLLVLVGAPRLRRLGISIDASPIEFPEHALYELLHRTDQDAAHGRYNALIRRLVSFERAAACAA